MIIHMVVTKNFAKIILKLLKSEQVEIGKYMNKKSESLVSEILFQKCPFNSYILHAHTQQLSLNSRHPNLKR